MDRSVPGYDLINNDSTPCAELVNLYHIREKGLDQLSMRIRQNTIVDKLIDRIYSDAHPDNPRDEIRTTTVESLSGETLFNHILRRLDDDYYSTVADELKPIINGRKSVLSPILSSSAIREGNITPKSAYKRPPKLSEVSPRSSAELESVNNASMIAETESEKSSSSNVLRAFDIAVPTLIDLSGYNLRSIAAAMTEYTKLMQSKISELNKSKSAEILNIFANRAYMESIGQSYNSFRTDYDEISTAVNGVDAKLLTMIVSDSSKSVRLSRQIKEMNKQVITAFTEFIASFRKKFINCLKKYYSGIEIFNNTDITLTINTVIFLRNIRMTLADSISISTKHRNYDDFMDILNRNVNDRLTKLNSNILDYIWRTFVNGDDALMGKIINKEPLSPSFYRDHKLIEEYYSLEITARSFTPIWNVKAVFDADIGRNDPLSIKRLIIFCIAYANIDKNIRNDPECRRLLYFLFPDFMHDFEGNNVQRFKKFEDIFNFLMPTIYWRSVSREIALADRILNDNSSVRGPGFIPFKKYIELTRLRNKTVIMKSTNDYLIDKLRTIMKTLKEPISDASSNEGDRDPDSLEIAKPPEKPAGSPTGRPSFHGGAASAQ
jgi:hypothetical protein